MPLEPEELRILGRIEGKLDAQAENFKQMATAISNLEIKLGGQIADIDRRLRELEIANPSRLQEEQEDHGRRIASLERSSAMTGAIAGAGASVGMAVVVELLKRKLGM
ncbi:hypothetical protein OR16_31659 [Cupriavidus basilensis OR16]|uniref:Uncharacterized protein n=1 Tax=Cupriavidus basilensis OR16 TaxID=1127483 RepID=H1SDM6_9BURK|nr:hypothetical protein [Cupriavidus basilensis]EHP39411.1 hypothetical protein OR16_31659 [Cupriavidus basilensis OR16]